MPLETDRLLAWVSPCGGLLDYSSLDPGGPPRPVLRRAVPAPAEPGWLAAEVALDADTGAETRLLDRTPVSARLAVGGLVIRYELTDAGLVIATAGSATGSLRVRLDVWTPASAVAPRAGTPAPETSAEGELGWALSTPVSLLVLPGPFDAPG